MYFLKALTEFESPDYRIFERKKEKFLPRFGLFNIVFTNRSSARTKVYRSILGCIINKGVKQKNEHFLRRSDTNISERYCTAHINLIYSRARTATTRS